MLSEVDKEESVAFDTVKSATVKPVTASEKVIVTSEVWPIPILSFTTRITAVGGAAAAGATWTSNTNAVTTSRPRPLEILVNIVTAITYMKIVCHDY